MRLAPFVGLLIVGQIALAGQKDDPPASTPSEASSQSNRVLVVVNDKPITEADLELFMLTRSVPPARQSKLRQQLLEQLVERRLVQNYLAGRKVEADPKELDAQVARFKQNVSKSGGSDSQQSIARVGGERALREALALPLAWQAYLARVVTAEAVRKFFEMNREKFDGTQVRASQIFLKLSDPANETARTQALAKLRQFRTEITAGTTTFADAARKHSQSPSSETGGDVGFFAFRGMMPAAFSENAFSLKVGEMSEPFATKFGAHLLVVTERKAGNASLEDVRPQVLTQMSNNLWKETVAKERAAAKIRFEAETP